MTQDNLEENETVLVDGDRATLIEDDSGGYRSKYVVEYPRGAVPEREEYGDLRTARVAFGRRELEPGEENIPVGIAVEGTNAIAAYLYLRAEEETRYRESNYEWVADRMGVAKSAAQNYVSRFLGDIPDPEED